LRIFAATSLRIAARCLRNVAELSRIFARLREILEDYRWRSSRFPLKIPMHLFNIPKHRLRTKKDWLNRVKRLRS